MFTLFAFISIYSFSFTQSYNYNWAVNFGGTNQDYGNAIATDADGNICVAGDFQGTADLDPGAGTKNLTSSGQRDIYVSKLSPTGNLIWAYKMGSSADDVPHGIAIDDAGYFYLVGRYHFTVDFDPKAGTANQTAAGLSDVFIAKYDTSCSLKWVRTFGSNSSDRGNAVAYDGNNGIYFTGGFSNTVNLGSTVLTSTGSNDVFVARYDTAGNKVWAFGMGNIGADNGYGIAVDADTNVYVTGHFRSSVDFDPSGNTNTLTTSGNSNDVFVAKYDAQGNHKFAFQIGASGEDYGYGIAVNSRNELGITGVFEQQVDFDPGTGTNNMTGMGAQDAFTLCTDTAGNFLWATQVGSSGNDLGAAITSDTAGNFVAAGAYLDTASFVDGATTTINKPGGIYNNMFLIGHDTLGNFIYVKTYTNSSAEVGSAVTFDNDNNLLLTGYFLDTLDFDDGAPVQNLITNGIHDAFVLKMRGCQVDYTNASDSACGNYTWNGMVYNSTGVYKQYLTNSKGCDSIVTMSLQIKNADTSVTQSGVVLTASASGARYQWVDCGSSYAALPGDTNAVLTATANGSYAVVVTQNGCVDTSSCYTVNSVAISEGLRYNNVRLFPNPVKEGLSIEFDGFIEPINYTVTDKLGKIVSSGMLTSSRVTVSVSELPAGVYFISIGNDNALVHKFLKE